MRTPDEEARYQQNLKADQEWYDSKEGVEARRGHAEWRVLQERKARTEEKAERSNALVWVVVILIFLFLCAVGMIAGIPCGVSAGLC